MKFPDPVFTVAGSDFPAEDPSSGSTITKPIFRNCKRSTWSIHRECKSLALFESEDGFNWDLPKLPLVRKLRPVGKGQRTVYRLERPQV